MPQYWGGPYRFRTCLRSHLPWFVLNTGIFDKGKDCAKSSGYHEWYNVDNNSSACYHCSIEKQGELWLEGVFKLYVGRDTSTHESMESAISEAEIYIEKESYLRIEAIEGLSSGDWWAYEHENKRWARS